MADKVHPDDDPQGVVAERPTSVTGVQLGRTVYPVTAVLGGRGASDDLFDLERAVLSAVSGLPSSQSHGAVLIAEDVRSQQALVRNFLYENSSALGGVKMMRTFPVFFFAEDRFELSKLISYSRRLGFEQLDVFPPLHGSTFQRLFCTDTEPLTSVGFWNKHPRLDIATTLLSRMGGIGAFAAIIGLQIHTGTVTPAQASAASEPAVTAPSTNEPTVKIETQSITIHQLMNGVTGFSQVTTPEEGRRQIEVMRDVAKVRSRLAGKKAERTGTRATRRLGRKPEK